MNLESNIEINKSNISSNFYDKLPEVSDDLKGEEVKGAFLALLQGLVGVSTINLAQNTPLQINRIETPKEENSDHEVLYEDKTHNTNEDQKNIHYKNTSSDKEEVVEVLNESKEDRVEYSSQVVKDIDTNEVAVNEVTASEVIANEVPVNEVPVNEIIANEVVAIKGNEMQFQTEFSQEVERSEMNNLKTPTVVASAEVEEEVIEVSAETLQKESLVIEKVDLQKQTNSEVASQYIDNEITEIPVDLKKQVNAKSQKSDSDPLYELDSDDQNSILNELKSFLAKESPTNLVSQDNRGSAAQKQSENLNAAKDALLARLLLGSDQYGSVQQLSKQNNVKNDLDLNGSFGLNLKSSLEKSSNERSSSVPLTRRGVASQEFVDKVKEVLEKAALNKDNNTISIKIDPPHLGEVTIKVSQKNGEIYAKLSAENKEIENILKSQSSELNTILQSLGFKSNEVHVQIGAVETQTDFSSLKDLNYNNTSEFQEKNTKKNTGTKQNISELVGSGINESKNLVQESGWVA